VRLPPGFRTGFAQRNQEALPILVILEDRLPPVHAIDHMADRPGYSTLNSRAMRDTPRRRMKAHQYYVTIDWPLHSGSTNPIVVPATVPTKFYRLYKP
jgi:hypothetical protein